MNHDPRRGAMKRAVQCVLAATGAALLLPAVAHAADTTNLANMPEARIQQLRGADQRVNYTELQKYGKWDDRNYQLNKEDLSYLSKNEAELGNQIPAFFRVELRKEWPHLMKTGPAQYPRAAWQLFKQRYGGFMRDGEIWGPKWGTDRFANERADNELQLNQVLGANEITVEINPTNSQRIIAGSNNNGGQEMYYSADGGQSWTIQGTLPNTCCDPTVAWSSDGSIAYVAALSGPIGVSFWRSFDQGVTWQDRVDLTTSGSDKEWMHVDISPSSPYQDSIYLTYHNGNTMQFARSTNGGDTFDITAFNSAPSGIGSDITTTSNGDLYYFYGAFGAQTITMLKSTDGGDTFEAPLSVASTNGSFDWPIPSMESRRAWIYVAADADRSGGAFDGSVYAAWTDTIDPENDGSASANHTKVNVAYSRDGGATWTITNPHPTDDGDTVDRFNQWMTVDEFGNVHVVYYDTRNSSNRTGVDLYYSFSTDGAVTWSDPERVSSETSANLTDGQEWGDYNGISVIGEKIVSVWTDNRNGPPNEKDVYGAELLNAGAAPGFTLGSQDAMTTMQAVCAPGDLDPIGLNVGQLQSFSSPVTLGFSGLPAGMVGNFSTNPVVPATPAATSTASVSVGGIADGDYMFEITGTASGATSRAVGVGVSVFSAAPGAASLTAPADGALDQSTSTVFSWSPVAGATSYTLEVTTDPSFGSIDQTVTTSATSATLPVSLATETQYVWRVTATNPCGSGTASAVFGFTTNVEICVTPALDIIDNATVSSDTALAETGTILDLVVSVDAAHTWVGDLELILTHEDTGTSVVLMDRPGVPTSTFGCSEDDINVEFSDASSTPVETFCSSAPAIGGVLQPEQPLAAFAGEDIGGTWTLSVVDNFGADQGVLNQWCLLPALDSDDIDTDGDGIFDDVDNCTLVSNADQRDTNGDGFGNVCDPDLNNDGVVNPIDLGLFKAVFFTSDADADLNGDGAVNPVDLGIVKAYFFGPPGPSALAP